MNHLLLGLGVLNSETSEVESENRHMPGDPFGERDVTDA